MFLALLGQAITADPRTFVCEGKSGPGKGKHVVLLAGDEEYRSEELLPQLARILAERHGFRCTVVFSLNDRGEIDPNEQTRQPGIQALRTADVCVMMLRFRRWDDVTMQVVDDYLASGRPIFALRTSTHAFQFPDEFQTSFRRYGWQSKEWSGGFGRHVLGETWVSHWGNHGAQATRGHVVTDHPVNRSVRDVLVPTDVYEANPPGDAEVLIRGEVVSGMNPSDRPATGLKKRADGTEQPINDPLMPVVWSRTFRHESGKSTRVLTCTMGSAVDFANEGFRRLTVNGVFWLAGIAVPDRLNVSIVGDYRPSGFGFNTFRKGVKPQDIGKL